MTAHFVLLMRNDSQIGPCMGAAQQHETRGLILGIVAAGFGLIDFAREQAAGTGRAPSLQTHVGQIQAGRDTSVQHVVIVGDRRLDFPTVRDKSDLMNRHRLFSKNRNPKFEIRNKSEGRNPKSRHTMLEKLVLGIWNLFRISDFEFRIYL
jgi:hypothetical protein